MITVAVAAVAYLGLVGFPEEEIRKKKFLSEEEVEATKRRLIAERGSYEGEKVTWAVIKEVIFDWKVWSL